MPFESKAQQKFMFSQKPELAKEFAKKTKDFKDLPEHADGSADNDALFKEDLPRAKHFPETADVFMNVKKDVQPIRGALEVSEDDTLMGRLAKRMASRDYIDKLDLGLGTKTQRAGKATMADMGQENDFQDLANSIPSKMNLSGPAKTELDEHKDTIKLVQHNPKEKPELLAKEIAKDHIQEMGKGYYPALKNMEDELKKKTFLGKENEKVSYETSSQIQNEKGFGLHNQTSDIQSFNFSDPFSNLPQLVLPGKNMAEQAKLKGNIYPRKSDED